MAVRRVLEEYVQKRDEVAAKASATTTMKLVELSNELTARLKALPAPEDEIATELERIAEDPRRDEEANLWIDAAQFHPSPKYLKSLCAMLEYESEKERLNFEGIVDILHDLVDERSIPSLVKALLIDQRFS